MRLELFVALRYLRARRKQAVVSVISLISVIGVAAGVMALIVALALNTGFRGEFQRRILGATSHVNLMGPAGSVVNGHQSVIERVSGNPQVVNVVAAVYGQCLLQAEGRQQPAILKGLPAEQASKVVPPLKEGHLEDFSVVQGGSPILLGKDLADSLVVSAGDFVRAFGVSGELSPLGRMPRVRNFRVAGIFESGLWDFDANWALVPLDAAQDFVGLKADQVSTLEFRIRDLYEARSVADDLENLAGPGFTSSTWIELNRPLFSALRLEKLAMFVAIGLIVLVASLNIISTLTLMVMDKNRDIAILTAMGGTPRLITRIFMIQGLIVGVLGTVVGGIAGVTAAWYFDTFKIFSLEPQVYSIPFVPFEWTFADLVIVSSASLLISFLATLYPARAASRLDPVEALRHE